MRGSHPEHCERAQGFVVPVPTSASFFPFSIPGHTPPFLVFLGCFLPLPLFCFLSFLSSCSSCSPPPFSFHSSSSTPSVSLTVFFILGSCQSGARRGPSQSHPSFSSLLWATHPLPTVGPDRFHRRPGWGILVLPCAKERLQTRGGVSYRRGAVHPGQPGFPRI